MPDRTYDIRTERARSYLRPRPAPYWARLPEKGEQVGYLCADDGGVWYARYRDRYGVRRTLRLGHLRRVKPERRYFMAMRMARAWIDKQKYLEREGVTLRQVLDDYIRELEREQSPRVALDVKRSVYRVMWGVEDRERVPILDKLVSDLTPDDIERCRRASGAEEQAQDAEIETDPLRVMFAAVNRAYRAGTAPDNKYWRGLVCTQRPSRRRPPVLGDSEIERLLGEARPDFREFLRTALLTGCRPEEIARIRVRHFRARSETTPAGQTIRYGELRVPMRDEAERVILISAEALFHLKSLSRHKSPDDLVHTQGPERPWEAIDWSEQMREACAAAGLPRQTGMYSLRDRFVVASLDAGLSAEAIARHCGMTVPAVERFVPAPESGGVAAKLNGQRRS
jgi:integrase